MRWLKDSSHSKLTITSRTMSSQLTMVPASGECFLGLCLAPVLCVQMLPARFSTFQSEPGFRTRYGQLVQVIKTLHHPAKHDEVVLCIVERKVLEVSWANIKRRGQLSIVKWIVFVVVKHISFFVVGNSVQMKSRLLNYLKN